MFDKGSESYKSDIKLGERYRDAQTGIEGIATSIIFYQHACERVCLERMLPDNKLDELMFDAPRLIDVKTEKVAKVEKTGGPGNGHELRSHSSTSR